MYANRHLIARNTGQHGGLAEKTAVENYRLMA
jgi:hypothetical protein